MSPNNKIVGIDVAKHKADVYFLNEGRHQTIDAKNYSEFAEELAGLSPSLAVMESTGGYERVLAGVLAAAGIPLAVVNARQVRDFAKATNQLAKTDAIDARIIAMFAEAVKLQPKPLLDQETQALRDLMERRRQLVAMRASESNREKQVINNRVKRSIKKMLKTLNEQLAELDEDLDKMIHDSPLWRDSEELLASIPGVGTITARTVLAEFPELGSMGRQQLSSLAGLAPMNHDSGKYRGQRHIRGGRANARAALYMAALSAKKYNPAIHAFYQRLKNSGKCFKVIITACMRKLLIVMNSVLKNKTAYLTK